MVNSGGAQLKLKPQHIRAVLLVLLLAGAVIAFYFLQRDDAVAAVNGEKITRSELYEAMYLQVGKNALDDLITRRLILQEGKKLGLSVTEEEIDEEINTIIRDNFMGIEEQFRELLEQYNITMESVRYDAKVNLMARKIARSQVEIADAQLEEYFLENRAMFDVPGEVEARHILVGSEDEALEVIALLNQGADFGELAKERSEDPGSKDIGGNLGFFKPGDMLPEFDEAAFSNDIGQISEPVETWHGFHVIEVLNKKDGRAVTFAEVKDDVYEAMVEEKVYGLINELVTRLRAEANIVYF